MGGTTMYTERNPWGLYPWIVLGTTLWLHGAPRVQGQCSHGDLDYNGNVGLLDMAALGDCLSRSGPGGGRGADRPAGWLCGPVDLDADRDVDLSRYAERIVRLASRGLQSARRYGSP